MLYDAIGIEFGFGDSSANSMPCTHPHLKGHRMLDDMPEIAGTAIAPRRSKPDAFVCRRADQEPVETEPCGFCDAVMVPKGAAHHDLMLCLSMQDIGF